MIVDDSVTIRRVMKNVLGRLVKEEIGVLEAGNGIEALAVLKEHHEHIALILLDVNMPEMNGEEALKKIREFEKNENSKKTPIIALTANSMEGDREKFLKIGFDDYLLMYEFNHLNKKDKIYKKGT